MLLNTPICDFGWQAPEFCLQDPDGVSHAFTDYLGEQGLLVMFICNHCPYVKAIAERLVEDVKTLQTAGINVLAVMSNDYQLKPEDNPVQMKQYAEKQGFTFPYLVDETQAVGKAYGAICTPDFFGLNKMGALQYRGRIDDALMGDPSHRTRELVDAMLQIARTGKGPKDQKSSMGCSIKWR